MNRLSLRFQEQQLGASILRVDRSLNTVYRVKIIGFNSDNNRRYTPEALKAAISLYEGVKVNVDHPENPDDCRSVYDRIGKLTNVRFVENKGLFGDLWLIPSHKLTAEVFDAAELMPDMFGLSHNAQGEGEEDSNGVLVVHKITEVRHVDLVADPATTNSLSESVNPKRKEKKMNIHEEDDKEVEKEEENPAMDEKEPEGKEYSEEETQEEADLLKEVIEAMGSEDSDEEKAAAIIKMIQSGAADKDEDSVEEEEDEDEAPKEDAGSEVTEADEEPTEEDDEDEEMKESKIKSKSKGDKMFIDLQEQLNIMKKQLYINRVAQEKKLTLKKAFLEQLTKIPYATIKAILENLSVAAKASKPKSGIKLQEHQSFKISKDTDLYQWMRN